MPVPMLTFCNINVHTSVCLTEYIDILKGIIVYIMNIFSIVISEKHDVGN